MRNLGVTLVNEGIGATDSYRDRLTARRQKSETLVRNPNISNRTAASE